MSINGGKSKSMANQNGLRRKEAATGKKLAPRSLRSKHKYEDDCSDIELKRAQVKREG
jgi:hypothetical protein